MITKWYCCAKCNEVASYQTGEGISTFPSCEFTTHFEYLVLGLDSEQEAREQLAIQREKLLKNKK